MKYKAKIWSWLAIPLLLIFLGFNQADARTNVGFGFSVGDYDYLPYEHSGINFSVNFSNVFDDYGSWVDVPRFGRSWRPYTTSGWRPYLYGHWIYTSYGPYWEGYEPWAWAGYHYGNWIWSEEFGWVWVPGNDWHPGRVVWGYSNDSLGWMPAPPSGYSYGCGYLSYNDCGYSDPYYSPRFSNISLNLWVFIDRHRFFNDNYADYYLGRDYARNVFVRRAVRIEPRVQRAQLERIVGQRVSETPVRVKELRLKNRTVRAVIPEGSETRIRKNGERVVKNIIAPAVSQKRRQIEQRDSRSRNEQRSPITEHRESSRDIRSNRNERDRDFSTRLRDRSNESRNRQFENNSRHSITVDRREPDRSDRNTRERTLDTRDKHSDSSDRFVDRSREQRNSDFIRPRTDSRSEREMRDRAEKDARERNMRDSSRRDEERRPTIERDQRPEPQIERRIEPRNDNRKAQSRKRETDHRKHNNNGNKPDHDKE